MASDHSKEPWRVGGVDCHSGCGPCIVSDHGVNQAWGADDVDYYGGHLVADSVCHPDARRIVAAVNACAGIDTEHLESVARRERYLLCVHPTGERREDGAVGMDVDGHSATEVSREDAFALLAAARELDRQSIGDFVYNIRDCELKGWEGPRVTAWGEASATLARIVKKYPETK